MQLVIKDTASAALSAVGAKVRHRKPVAEAIGLAVVGMAIRSFNDPAMRPAPWAPLQEATIAQKLKEGTSTAILKRRTLLFRSWRVFEANSDFVKVGSDRFYAMFHQFGTKRMVARPMLPILDGKFTPLAVQRMVSVAKAALAGLLLPHKRK